MMLIGTKLRVLREERGLTQKQVADEIGCVGQLISNYELDKRTPDYKTLVALADLYGVTVDYILGRSTNPMYHYNTSITKEEADLLAVFQKLPDEYRKDVMRYARLNLMDIGGKG